jgi:hypothetical protein
LTLAFLICLGRMRTFALSLATRAIPMDYYAYQHDVELD